MSNVAERASLAKLAAESLRREKTAPHSVERAICRQVQAARRCRGRTLCGRGGAPELRVGGGDVGADLPRQRRDGRRRLRRCRCRCVQPLVCGDACRRLLRPRRARSRSFRMHGTLQCQSMVMYGDAENGN